MNANIKKRILYRSKHRGCKEMDILLGNFASYNLDTLDDITLKDYEELLSEADDDILAWMVGRLDVPLRLINNKALRNLIDFENIKFQKK